MSSLDAVRARFARNEGLPFRGHLDGGQHPGGAQRTWRAVSGPSVQPCDDDLGFPESGTQRRPQLPRCRIANHCTPCSQWHHGVLAKYGQLLQRAKSCSHRCSLHFGNADSGRVTHERW